MFLATAIYVYLTEQKRAASLGNQITDQSHKIGTRWVVSIDKDQYPIMIKQVKDGYNIRYGTSRITIRSNWTLGSHLFTAIISGQKVNVKIVDIPTGYRLTHSGITVNTYVRSPRMSELEALMPVCDDAEGLVELVAPLAGQIISINVKAGEEVVLGQDLVVLTAMKMENIITAERVGKIAKVMVTELENVISGQVLLEFE